MHRRGIRYRTEPKLESRFFPLYHSKTKCFPMDTMTCRTGLTILGSASKIAIYWENSASPLDSKLVLWLLRKLGVRDKSEKLQLIGFFWPRISCAGLIESWITSKCFSSSETALGRMKYKRNKDLIDNRQNNQFSISIIY